MPKNKVSWPLPRPVADQWLTGWNDVDASRPSHLDPTQHMTTLKTVWQNIKVKAGITGRWHDAHTLVTGLAESGPVIRRSWTLLGTSHAKCWHATVTFAWKPGARPWNVL